MNEKEKEDWIKAGRIAAIARDYGASLIKKGANVREILDKVESKIISEGAVPAFPAQMSLNETAAHFCPSLDEDVILNDEIIKLDVGAMVNGAIGDTAITVDLSGNYEDLLKASREAFEAAFRLIRPGAKLGDIGRAIESTIKSYGFSSIRNLSGHTIKKYELHAFPSIPNYDNEDELQLEEGQVIAIEPFATTGVGRVIERGQASIFVAINLKPVRNPITRKIIDEIKSYNNMPFTTRWIERKFSKGMSNIALSELLRNNMLEEFKPIVEQSNGLVSQYEHTVLVLDKPVILTLTQNL